MKRIKYTIIDSCGIVQSVIVYKDSVYAVPGENVSLPNGTFGLLIRSELVLEADEMSTTDLTKPT